MNSLPKSVTRQSCDCDLNPGPSAPEFRTLTTQLLATNTYYGKQMDCVFIKHDSHAGLLLWGHVGQTDRLTDGWTSYRFIDTAPHTMWAVPTKRGQL